MICGTGASDLTEQHGAVREMKKLGQWEQEFPGMHLEPGTCYVYLLRA